ncbi:MAG: penicillin-binding protein [Ruminococcaceae bacterium]|nr:penicillin-binding protein [Oscillospiraceae bacterium]
MNRIAQRSIAMLVVVALMLGGLVFFLVEYFMNADKWVMTEGSPHVYNGGSPAEGVKPNIGCGVITDRDGALLLDTNDGRVYSSIPELRQAMLHWVGDQQGNISAPAVSTYAEEIVGFDPVNGLYSYGGSGQASLTVSAKVQLAALEAMGDRAGTVAVYNYKTGEILCAVTTPTFDPESPPDDPQNGIYVNRFTQSKYTPGSIFKIVTTAAALEEIPDIREQTFRCTGTYSFSDKSDPVTCENVHGKLSLYDAMAQSCNCAYASIVEQLGPEILTKYVEKYQVLNSVQFDGITTKAGNFTVENAGKNQIAWSGIGQHKNQVNPCAYMTFMGAIANGGSSVQPYIVSKVTCGDDVTYAAETVTADAIMPAEIAQELQAMMRHNVEVKYGVDNFPDLTVCAKSGTAQSDTKDSNALFAGFVTDEKYPLAFMVVVEEGGYGRHACVPVISQVLNACKEVMDAS